MGQNYRINTRPQKNSKYSHARLTLRAVILLCRILFCLSEAAFFDQTHQCNVMLN